jgi:hypothetical protein
MTRTLLLVTGAGRSGTSTMAGALHHLGVHVPGPHLQANASNPRGFYESRWSVQFHNQLLKRAHVSIADGRPQAAGQICDAVTDADRSRLRDWVAEHTDGHDVTVVKDPRTTWTLPEWSAAAEELGLRPAFVVMLRHPAEVLGSRATHYKAGLESMGEAGYATRNLAGWTNALLMVERGTRGHARSFVRYDDLLSDWRTALGAAAQDLGIDLDVDASHARAGEHPVDGFIDPDLARHRLTWTDVDVLPDLEAVASQVWAACERLAERHGADDDAQQELDAAGARYAAMYRAAELLSRDAITAEVAQQVAARMAEQAPAAESARPARPAGQPPAPPAVGGREALRILASAARRRLRRR